MRIALELLLLIGGLVAAGFFVDRYIRARSARPQLRTAYFSGGSLDGQEKELEQTPKTLTSGDDIYRRDEVTPRGAIYVYVGTVDDPKALSYEP